MSSATPPPTATAPLPVLGQSLIASLEAGAAEEQSAAEELKHAYLVTLKGSGEERIHYDDQGPEVVYGRRTTEVWGRRFVRFADDSLVDPGEVAAVRPVTPEEAQEITAEAEAEEEHKFEAVEFLKRALAATHATPPQAPPA